MRLVEITKRDEFKAILADPNYQDVLDKFKGIKTLGAGRSIRFSYSYKPWVSAFTITATVPHIEGRKSRSGIFSEVSKIMVRVYEDYDIWSDMVTDVTHGKSVSTRDYHIYTDSRS